MKQGTMSILFGCHSPVHSVLVTISWVILHRRLPELWELVCIFLHDVGHVGKNYLSNPDEKSIHWKLGATIAGRLFGPKGYALVAGHSHSSDHPESSLRKPDKYSWYLAPEIWIYSNTVFEPKLKMGYTRWGAVHHFKNRVMESIESGKFRSTHQIYLERCKKNG